MQTELPQGNILVGVPNLLVAQWFEEGKRFLDSRAWNFLVYPSSESQVAGFWNAWEEKELDSEAQRMTTIVFISHQVSVYLAASSLLIWL